MIFRVTLLLSLIFVFKVSLAKDTLHVGYNDIPPFVSEEDGELSGPSIWLCEQVQEDLNLTFVYQKMQLDSLLYHLKTGEIDLCASPLTITASRSENIFFTSPYYVTHSSLLIKKASESTEIWAFIKSFFSWRFFSAMGALAIVILIFGFLTWIFERKKNEKEFGEGIKGLWNGFWWSAVTMTTVGYGDKSPKTVGGRIVAIIWMFTAIVIISGFTASIASSLTTNNMANKTWQIEELKKSPIGTIDQSGTNQWLINNFYGNVKTYDSFENCLDALDKDEIIAFAYDRPILKEIIKEDSSEKYELSPSKFNPQYYAMGVSFSVSDTMRNRLNTSILRNTERMDWKALLAEYDL